MRELGVGIFLHVNSRPTTDDDDVTTIVLSRAVTIRRVPSPHPYSYTKAARNTHTLTRFALRTPSLPTLSDDADGRRRRRSFARSCLAPTMLVAGGGPFRQDYEKIFIDFLF